MPELPDIELYIEALRLRIQNRTLLNITPGNPFLPHTVTPGIDDFKNRELTEIRRIGKRIAPGFDNGHWQVIHLMVAGRLQWIEAGKKPPAKKPLLTLEFTSGHLLLTGAGSKRRESLHLFASELEMSALDRGGLEVLEITEDQFKERLQIRNHTLKRALTDQSLFSGIGNAYSDEILHRAHLSPVLQTQKMDDDQIAQLYNSCISTLEHWKLKLLQEARDTFPKKVTAFKKDMAVHGKFGQPCPVCNTKVQRIRYASNETNYCPRCQTNGKLLADRSLSKLLKNDWPKTIGALEETDRVQHTANRTGRK